MLETLYSIEPYIHSSVVFSCTFISIQSLIYKWGKEINATNTTKYCNKTYELCISRIFRIFFFGLWITEYGRQNMNMGGLLYSFLCIINFMDLLRLDTWSLRYKPWLFWENFTLWWWEHFFFFMVTISVLWSFNFFPSPPSLHHPYLKLNVNGW